jgi:GTP cyclohydrolase I
MQKIELSKSECEMRAAGIAKELRKISEDNRHVAIYGVPRGGIPVAYMVAEAYRGDGYTAEVVFKIEQAEIIVDDIIDSGKTREKYANEPAPFFALVNKKYDGNHWFVFPWEVAEGTGAEDVVTRFLQYIGEDAKRNGLRDSPQRVVRSWDELYKGYKMNPEDFMKIFDELCDEMVILRNIEFYSMCEHHFLPFYGKVHIAYIPQGGKVVGVSKLARIVECFSRRLQIQERLTSQITDTIEKYLKPVGCACFIEAKHLCMMARGIEKQNSVMITSSLKGSFKDKSDSRIEFLLLNGRGEL